MYAQTQSRTHHLYVRGGSRYRLGQKPRAYERALREPSCAAAGSYSQLTNLHPKMTKTVSCYACKALFKNEEACKMHATAKRHQWRAPSVPSAIATTQSTASVPRSAIVAKSIKPTTQIPSKSQTFCTVCRFDFDSEAAYQHVSHAPIL